MGAGVLPLFSYVFFFWLLYLIRLAHEKRMLGHITLLHCQCLSSAESFRVARLLFPLTGYSPENRGGEVIFMDSGARQRMDYCWRIQRAASPQPSPLRGEGADGERSPAVSYRSEERRVGKECRSRWSPYH